MLKTLSLLSSEEANNCKEKADASTQALKAYYQQSATSQYNLDEALDALVTLTDRSQKLVHAEQQKMFLELSQKPFYGIIYRMSRTIYTWSNKKPKITAFSSPQGQESIQTHPRGEMVNSVNRKPNKPNQGPRAFLPRKGNQQAQKIKTILELLNLWNFTIM